MSIAVCAASTRRRRDDVPRIVAELVGAGERIYGVRVLRSDLEEVYLDAVGSEPQESEESSAAELSDE